MNAFEQLNRINVNDHTERKNGLTYLSWAWAWGELKKRYPDSYYTVYENADGLFYHTDGKTCWVKTGVTLVDGEKQLEHVEYLPVMDMRNKSIPVGNVTSFDVNKAVQRSLTKAVARHGLGLYIYAGEDLPEGDEPQPKVEQAPDKPGNRIPPPEDTPVLCEVCGVRFADFWDGERLIKAVEQGKRQRDRFGKTLCAKCAKGLSK